MGGLNQVLLSPMTHSVFDGAAFRTWASEEAQCGASLGQLYRHSAGGIRGLAFVLKENVRGFGWGRWKGHKQGSCGDQNKQTGVGGHIRSLSQTQTGQMMPDPYHDFSITSLTGFKI